MSKKNPVRISGKKLRHDKTYRAWQNMHLKCRSKSSKSYKNFGGAGITVCDRWSEFSNFLADMGEKPSSGSWNTFLNRHDKSKGFFKENCFWSTRIDWRD